MTKKADEESVIKAVIAFENLVMCPCVGPDFLFFFVPGVGILQTGKTRGNIRGKCGLGPQFKRQNNLSNEYLLENHLNFIF